MTEQAKDTAAIDVTALLSRYSFDLGGYPLDRLVDYWLHRYPSGWIRLAVLEALYQGRYKVVSVEQILVLWRRRGKPLYHFNREFERIVCGRFLRHLLAQPEIQSETTFWHHPTAESPSSLDAEPDQSFSLGATEEVDLASGPEPDSISGAPSGIEQDTEIEQEFAAPPSDPVSRLDFEPEVFPKAQNSPESALNPPIRELPIQPFKPAPNHSSDLESLGEMSWSRAMAGKQPIHQFIPTPEPSEFYTKLKAVAQESSTSDRNSIQPPPEQSPSDPAEPEQIEQDP